MALLATGCESDTDRFRNALRRLRTQVEQEKAQMASTLRVARMRDPATVAVLGHEIDALAATTTAISNLSPPDGMSHYLAAYGAANQKLVVALRSVTASIASGHKHALSVASAQAQDAAGSVSRAADALDTNLH